MENRYTDATVPWRQWFRERYARYWYGVGCLFLDLVIAGTVLTLGSPPTQAWQYGGAMAAVVVLAYLEFRGYLWLWPPTPTDVD